MKEYTLQINAVQADVLVKALDLFSRVGMGQFREILNHPTVAREIMKRPPLPSEESLRGLLETIKREVYDLPPNAYHSIGSREIGDENRVAYDLLQVIQYRRSWDDPNPVAKKEIENGKTPFGVNYHEPMKTGEQPLAKIKREDEYPDPDYSDGPTFRKPTDWDN